MAPFQPQALSTTTVTREGLTETVPLERRSTDTSNQAALAIAICLFVINIVLLVAVAFFVSRLLNRIVRHQRRPLVRGRAGRRRQHHREWRDGQHGQHGPVGPDGECRVPVYPGSAFLPCALHPSDLGQEYVSLSDIVGPTTQDERDALGVRTEEIARDTITAKPCRPILPRPTNTGD